MNDTVNNRIEIGQAERHADAVTGNTNEILRPRPETTSAIDNQAKGDQTSTPANDRAGDRNAIVQTKPETTADAATEGTDVRAGMRKRRTQAEIDADDVAEAAKVLAAVKARQARNREIESQRAADTGALNAGKELVGELLQGAVLAGNAQAWAVWDSLTSAAKGTRSRQMQTMREILEKRRSAG